VKPPENGHRPLRARRLPPGDRFQGRQDLVEAVPQVLEHVVSVEALAMSGVGGRRATDEHGARHHGLQMTLCGQQTLPVRHVAR
jgi:hypothetical protein